MTRALRQLRSAALALERPRRRSPRRRRAGGARRLGDLCSTGGAQLAAELGERDTARRRVGPRAAGLRSLEDGDDVAGRRRAALAACVDAAHARPRVESSRQRCGRACAALAARLGADDGHSCFCRMASGCRTVQRRASGDRALAPKCSPCASPLAAVALAVLARGARRRAPPRAGRQARRPCAARRGAADVEGPRPRRDALRGAARAPAARRALAAGRTAWTDRRVTAGVTYRYTVRPCRRKRCAKPRAVRVTAAGSAKPPAPAPAAGPCAGSPLVGGCPMLPADNPWNTDISQAPSARTTTPTRSRRR